MIKSLTSFSLDAWPGIAALAEASLGFWHHRKTAALREATNSKGQKVMVGGRTCRLRSMADRETRVRHRLLTIWPSACPRNSGTRLTPLQRLYSHSIVSDLLRIDSNVFSLVLADSYRSIRKSSKEPMMAITVRDSEVFSADGKEIYESVLRRVKKQLVEERRIARDAVESVRRFSLVYPIGRPRFLAYRGTIPLPASAH